MKPAHEGAPRALWIPSGLLLAFLLLPLASLVAFLPPGALLEHLRSPAALRAVAVTLRTSAVATAACIALGLPLAWLLARRRFPGRDLVDTLVDLPLTIPPVVAGVGLLLAFGRRGLLGAQLEMLGLVIPFSWLAVVMAQVFVAAPFFVRAARAGIESVDPRLEQAAATLGAGPWRTFFSVTLPLARPALLAGVVLAWARALSEFGATMMFAGNLPGRTQTLTLAVMSAMESDLDTAVAVSVLALLLGAASLLAARALARRLVPHA